MSVERVERKGGTVWRVRWRDASGEARSRVAGRKADAVLLDAEIKRRRRVGDVLPARRQDVTLGEFAVEWFDRMAPSVSERTAAQRALAWDTRLLPLLGHVPLRQLSLEHVALARSAMHEAGLSDATIRSYLSILSSVLARAAEWGRIPASPMKGYRLPSGRRTRVVRPLTEDELARLCAGLSERGARVVTILERSGLRPGELRALRREHVQDRLYVMGTKTNRSRTVPIDALLREARDIHAPGLPAMAALPPRPDRHGLSRAARQRPSRRRAGNRPGRALGRQRLLLGRRSRRRRPRDRLVTGLPETPLLDALIAWDREHPRQAARLAGAGRAHAGALSVQRTHTASGELRRTSVRVRDSSRAAGRQYQTVFERDIANGAFQIKQDGRYVPFTDILGETPELRG